MYSAQNIKYTHSVALLIFIFLDISVHKVAVEKCVNNEIVLSYFSDQYFLIFYREKGVKHHSQS